jgi:DNA-directed RNA polymerase sigma subunit (sigma70/sigma32)
MVGRRLGTTRERARQIEQDALSKLRRPSVATRLRAG